MKFHIEEWRPAVGFESTYEVSSLGRLRSRRRRLIDKLGRLGRNYGGDILSPEVTRLGYLRIRMSDGVNRCRVLVHRIVADAFMEPPPSESHEVNHIDGVKSNNRPENLEWATRAENMNHARDAGLWDPKFLWRGKAWKEFKKAAR